LSINDFDFRQCIGASVDQSCVFDATKTASILESVMAKNQSDALVLSFCAERKKMIDETRQFICNALETTPFVKAKLNIGYLKVVEKFELVQMVSLISSLTFVGRLFFSLAM
jgi:hypothetical protein